MRKFGATWAVSWLTSKEQRIYTELYDEKPYLPAVQGSIYNLVVTVYLIVEVIIASSNIYVNSILGGLYGVYLIQNIPRAITSIIKNRSYPPPALITAGINLPAYVKKAYKNRDKLVKRISHIRSFLF